MAETMSYDPFDPAFKADPFPFYAHLRAGQPVRYVAARGSDVPRGTNVLKRGTTIGPQQAAVLATVGAWEVECFERPSVVTLVPVRLISDAWKPTFPAVPLRYAPVHGERRHSATFAAGLPARKAWIRRWSPEGSFATAVIRTASTGA